MPVPPIDPQAAERQTLDELRGWHGGIVEALVDHRLFVQRAIREGSPVTARYMGMTEGDVDAHYDAQRGELDRLTVLNLVASTEANSSTTISVESTQILKPHCRGPIRHGIRSSPPESSFAQTLTSGVS